jgi:hypothetical protein
MQMSVNTVLPVFRHYMYYTFTWYDLQMRCTRVMASLAEEEGERWRRSVPGAPHPKPGKETEASNLRRRRVQLRQPLLRAKTYQSPSSP